MSLDLFTSNIDDAVNYAARVSAPEMPSTFEDNFYDAWNKGYLTNQSISGETRKITARQRMVDDAIAETGDRSFEQSAEGGGFDTEAFNAKVAQHKALRPDLDLQTISDESIQAAADDIGKRQLASSNSFAHREQTTGGSFGKFFGSTAAALTDPVNLIAFPLAAPESLGVLGTALAWGAIGTGSQVGIEYLNSTAMERIQPGYGESGQPVTNVLEAGLGGAVLGGGLKGLAAAWTRAKTGSWPRTVRDAGNVVESEAQIAGTNPLPGVEGEAAHRTALNKAIEDLANGRPVEIDHIITPDLLERSRGLISRLESDQPLSLPIVNRRAIELAADQERLSARDAELAASMDSLPAGDASAADRLNRLDAVERQIAETTDPVRLRKLNDRRDQILVDTNPEALRAAAAPIEQRRLMQSERARIADQLQEITDEHARLQASMLSPLKLPVLGQRQRIPTGPRGQFEMDLKPPEGTPVRAGALPGVTPRINQFGDVVKDTFNYPIKDGGGKTVGNIEFINGTASDSTADAITIRAAGIEDATARGQGLGTRAYKEIIDWAHAQDKTVYSSGSTNDLSDAVYERLRKQGYDVKKFKDGADYTFEIPPSTPAAPSAPKFDRGDLLEAQQVYREALWRTQQPESNASHVRFAEEAKAKLDTIERALAQQSKISPDAATALRDELTPAKIEEARQHPDMEETVARDLDKLMASKLSGSPDDVVQSYTTAKGSQYKVHRDGTTTRDKAARPDVGHEGDSGPKTRSAKTIYVDADKASALSGAGIQGANAKGFRVIVGDGKASLLSWNEQANKWGISPSSRDIPFTTTPEVGKAPVELWKPSKDVPGHEAYRGQHAGNKITAVSDREQAVDFEVPMGVTVDAEGRTVPNMVKVEDVVAEADARSAAAKEIEACVGPYPPEAA